MSTLLLKDMPDEDYRRAPGLSSTAARTLLRSPARYRWELDHPRVSDTFDLGRLVHALVLEQPHEFCARDWDGRTKEGKAKAAEAAASGRTPLSRDVWVQAHDMAAAVQASRTVSTLLKSGDPEVSMFADVDDVRMKGRLDWLGSDGTIVDLKTTKNAEPDAFARSCADYGYHIQASWYNQLAQANDVWVLDFLFIAVEKTPPYLVSVVRLDGDALVLGSERAAQARETYRDCQALDMWPEWANAPEVSTVSLPRWAFF